MMCCTQQYSIGLALLLLLLLYGALLMNCNVGGGGDSVLTDYYDHFNPYAAGGYTE